MIIPIKQKRELRVALDRIDTSKRLLRAAMMASLDLPVFEGEAILSVLNASYDNLDAGRDLIAEVVCVDLEIKAKGQ